MNDSNDRLGTAAVLALSALSGACSSGSAGSVPAVRQVANSASALSSAPPGLVAVADGGAGLIPPTRDAGTAFGTPYAYAVSTVPSTRCTIQPTQSDGGTNGSNPVDTIYSDATGEVRFYIVPEAQQNWGTTLSLQCGFNADAGPSSSYLIDLNDSSTFKLESESDLAPQLVGVRPALTDLAALSAAQLAEQAYPPRPDLVQAPAQYSRWAKKVSMAMDIYVPVPITVIGAKATSPYEGTYTGESSVIWTGVIQAAGGFSTLPSTGSYLFANINESEALYEEYMAELLVPSASGCFGESPNCAGQFLWAGIGGYNKVYDGVQIAPGGLIQSGFETTMYPTGPVAVLFGEFAPDMPNNYLPPQYKYSTGDLFTIWGWAAGTTCDGFTTGVPSQACFWFEDDSQDWVYTQMTAAFPADVIWYPNTVEYITEYSGPGENPDYGYGPDYGFAVMDGVAWDSNGTLHVDPGGGTSASDPFIQVEEEDSYGNTCSVIEWSAIDPVEDPMWFFAQPCGR